MSKFVLITGGAGFIGSHLADELIAHGTRVRVLDNLLRQVHGATPQRPPYLHPAVELMQGNITDPQAVRQACHGVDIVFHLAARVGVGQSMYEISRYTETNNGGTATLLEELIQRPVERLVVASSMSIYGEGLYRRRNGEIVAGYTRPLHQLQSGQWELLDEEGKPLEPIPTDESKTPELASVYALSKYDQEKMCLIVGNAYQIPTVALRFFNIYGSRQALSNPYTGVLAIFASRLLSNAAPLVYEDGYQRRDFVHVQDVARACRLAAETDGAAGQVFNIGSGQVYTIRELAARLAKVLNKDHLTPEVTGKYRAGDIRHCFADIRRAQAVLGYQPTLSLEDGLHELTEWLQQQQPTRQVANANQELAKRGLLMEKGK